jgi:hypothetical protein
MAGHRPWSEIRDRLKRRPDFEELDARATAELQQEIEVFHQALGELGGACRRTQAIVASLLNVPSRALVDGEHQSDLYLTTLAEQAAALGWKLEFVATSGGERIEIGLEQLLEETGKATAIEQAVAA